MIFASQTSGPLRLLRALAGSTFVLILVLLACCDWAISYESPLKLFNNEDGAFGTRDPFVAKLPKYLYSSRNADVIILGSSLVLVPAVRCDDAFHNVRTRYDYWYSQHHCWGYDKSDYLQYLLSKADGKQIDVVNLGVAGSVMSEHFLIFKKCLEAGKSPKLVIIGVAPRDFVDNTFTDMDQRPVYRILSGFSSFDDLLKAKTSFVRMCDFLAGKVSHFYQQRSDLRNAIVDWSARATGRPINLYQAMNGITSTKGATDSPNAPDYTPKPNTLSTLKGLVDKVYYPLNYKRFSEQMVYFESALKLAREHHIQVLVANMPVVEQLDGLLPQTFLDDYRSHLKSITTTYGALLVEPGYDQKFTLTDFEEGSHLNATGGPKFYKDVVDFLVRNKKLPF